MREGKLTEPLEGQHGFYYTLWVDDTSFRYIIKATRFVSTARTNPSVFINLSSGSTLERNLFQQWVSPALGSFSHHYINELIGYREASICLPQRQLLPVNKELIHVTLVSPLNLLAPRWAATQGYIIINGWWLPGADLHCGLVDEKFICGKFDGIVVIMALKMV